MAFLYPKQFPALCVTETGFDPKDIRNGEIQVYPVGMTAKQAMALVWRPREFQIESSYVIGTDCGDSCSYQTGSISGTSDDSNDHAKLTKMSDLVCLEYYDAEYGLVGQGDAYTDCAGDPQPPYEINAYLGIHIGNNQIITFDFPIYLFEELYYISMIYDVGAGTANLSEIQGRTLSVGVFTIKINGVDDITLPIYNSGATEFCNQPVETATFTMTNERQTN